MNMPLTEDERAVVEREIKTIIDNLPPECVVRVCEGGGPENLFATLGVSCAKMVRKLGVNSKEIAETKLTASRWIDIANEWRTRTFNHLNEIEVLRAEILQMKEKARDEL